MEPVASRDAVPLKGANASQFAYVIRPLEGGVGESRCDEWGHTGNGDPLNGPVGLVLIRLGFLKQRG